MTNQNQYHNIPADKFRFAKRTDLSHDKKFDTKPVSYFQGAWRRFCKNKGAVVGGVVILFLVLFAIIAPFFTPYTPSYHDKTILYVTPKLAFMEEHNIPFWDGGRVKSNSTLGYLKDLALEQETGKDVIKSEVEISEDGTNYTYRYDTYFGVGFGKYKEITRTEFRNTRTRPVSRCCILWFTRMTDPLTLRMRQTLTFTIRSRTPRLQLFVLCWMRTATLSTTTGR